MEENVSLEVPTFLGGLDTLEDPGHRDPEAIQKRHEVRPPQRPWFLQRRPFSRVPTGTGRVVVSPTLLSPESGRSLFLLE